MRKISRYGFVHGYNIHFYVIGSWFFFVLFGCVVVRRDVEHSNGINILISILIRRFPRLFIPSTVALFFDFVILYFRPFYCFNECHKVGEGTVNVEKNCS